jgi:hypothetical protein
MSTAKPSFNPDDLRIVGRDLLNDHAASMPEAIEKPASRRTKRTKFAHVPFGSNDWIVRAYHALGPRSGAGIMVAIYLLMQFGLNGEQSDQGITVSNQYLKALKVTRQAKYRVLKRLEKAELIEIESVECGRALKVRIKNLRIQGPTETVKPEGPKEERRDGT